MHLECAQILPLTKRSCLKTMKRKRDPLSAFSDLAQPVSKRRKMTGSSLTLNSGLLRRQMGLLAIDDTKRTITSKLFIASEQTTVESHLWPRALVELWPKLIAFLLATIKKHQHHVDTIVQTVQMVSSLLDIKFISAQSRRLRCLQVSMVCFQIAAKVAETKQYWSSDVNALLRMFYKRHVLGMSYPVTANAQIRSLELQILIGLNWKPVKRGNALFFIREEFYSRSVYYEEDLLLLFSLECCDEYNIAILLLKYVLMDVKVICGSSKALAGSLLLLAGKIVRNGRYNAMHASNVENSIEDSFFSISSSWAQISTIVKVREYFSGV